MIRLLVAAGLMGTVGICLLLSQVKWFSRPSLKERLRPYARSEQRRSSLLTFASLREAIGPLATEIGGYLSRLFGVTEDLDLRLRRVHSPLDVTAFRVRQLGACVLALMVGLVTLAIGMPLPLSLLTIAGGPLLVFLLLEQRVTTAAKRWSEQVMHELPVVAEQLAMLLSAGFSLGSAINRMAARGEGACAVDLRGVSNRIRQGVGEIPALREWSDRVRVEALERLVTVLAANSEMADIGRLVSTEARQTRRDAHRRTIALIERRGEQVWIPVTVATLIPGVILIAIPFLTALKAISGV